ncbi:hypothetical protein A2U01_0060275, partial [Trifolium medium]|nr:hypothetical protein [Trifolium medium]
TDRLGKLSRHNVLGGFQSHAIGGRTVKAIQWNAGRVRWRASRSDGPHHAVDNLRREGERQNS